MEEEAEDIQEEEKEPGEEAEDQDNGRKEDVITNPADKALTSADPSPETTAKDEETAGAVEVDPAGEIATDASADKSAVKESAGKREAERQQLEPAAETKEEMTASHEQGPADLPPVSKPVVAPSAPVKEDLQDSGEAYFKPKGDSAALHFCF